MAKQNDIIILGAGAVGVAAAWELRRRGWHTTLIDRRQPARETSYGNAGIAAESAAVPFNNPVMRRQLPQLLLSDNPTLHWRFSYVAANLPWCIQYLRHTRQASALARARHLHRLIKRGMQLHHDWLAQVNKTHHIRTGGWLKLYRSRQSFERAAVEHGFWKSLGVSYRVIEGDAIGDLLPAATPVFARAALIEQAFAIIDPGEIIHTYAKAFCSEGGELIEQEATGLQPGGNGWQVQLANGEQRHATHVLVALGPWCAEFLRPLGIRLPMCFERGAHRHFNMSAIPAPAIPFTDMDGGYSAVMQQDKLRITSGVYFAGLDAPPQTAQLAAAEKSLRQAINGVGDKTGDDWYGARPTLPDTLLFIGASRRKGLWYAGGCQHVGLMSSPAVGECIAQQLNGERPTVEAAAFAPGRYNL